MAKPTISGLVAKAKADLERDKEAPAVVSPAPAEAAPAAKAEENGTARATYTLPADLVELIDRLGAYRRLSLKRDRAKGVKTEDPRQSASAIVAAALREVEPKLREQLEAFRRADPL